MPVDVWIDTWTDVEKTPIILCICLDKSWPVFSHLHTAAQNVIAYFFYYWHLDEQSYHELDEDHGYQKQTAEK